jgi:hypothetical protein
MLSLRLARDVKLLHVVTLRHPSEAEARRGAVRPSDHPVGVPEDPEDVLAFDLRATSQVVRERCPHAMLRLGPCPIRADLIGIPTRCANRCTKRYSSGASCGLTSCAPYMDNTILSENQ